MEVNLNIELNTTTKTQQDMELGFTQDQWGKIIVHIWVQGYKLMNDGIINLPHRVTDERGESSALPR